MTEGGGRSAICLALLCLLLGSSRASSRVILDGKLDDDLGPKSKEAYVTLLYGESFVLGVRVLGQSIRDTQTTRDLVLIVTGKISTASLRTLQMDGWRVKLVDEIANPGKGPQKTGFPDKFSSVYTKLSIFNLVEYTKAVYLDADTIMTHNSDALFKCPGFCAAMRHSERLNSGVMVVSPSHELYEDMVSKITTLPSYTGGDQGFLNEYFHDFMNGPVFDPSKEYKGDEAKLKTMRLPTKYNADIGLYVINSNRWMIPEEDIRVVHFTLGPIKPWHWWASWIIKDIMMWKIYRKRLPRDSLGYSCGTTPSQHYAKIFMMILPVLFLALVARRCLGKNGMSGFGSYNSPHIGGPCVNGKQIIPRRFTGLSIFVGYLTLLLPVGLAIRLVPHQIDSFWGWFLAYEWVLLGHYFLFGCYLGLCYRWGNRTAINAPPSQRGAFGPKPWKVTLKSASMSTLWILISPWLADMLFVQNFITKVIATCVAAVIANVILTHVYASLPMRWFACGRSEGHVKSMDGV
ncbi:hypothetical protein BSKO_04600 [Bryopsis sp. KO-2023]|nr:hypothetical protein BSKO_04600 [Bryopsis sp. KO-2023]